MDWNSALLTYSLLTIGDGLVSTIPSIIVSTATGLLVSRAASEAKMGEEFLAQLTFNSQALKMVSGVLVIFAIVPRPACRSFPCAGGPALLSLPGYLRTGEAEEGAMDKKARAAQGKAPHPRTRPRGGAGPAAPGYA